MIVNLENKEYQVNKYFTGSVLQEGIDYPFTLEIIDVYGEDWDFNINWQQFPPNIDECEKLILEQYKEQQTI